MQNKKNFKRDRRENNNGGRNNNITKKVSTYTKQYDIFENGIVDLRDLGGVFADILYVDGYEDTPDVAADKMLEAFQNHFPTVEKNRFWSLNISSTRCMLKTDQKVSFGWKFKYRYDKESETTNISDIEFTITLFGDQGELEENLVNNGWVLLER